MITNEDAISAMETMGGGFIQALAHAWRLADSRNRARLERAFGDEFENYRAHAVMLKNVCKYDEKLPLTSAVTTKFMQDL